MAIYIFDKDNTLVAPVANGDRTRPPNTIEEQVLLPGRKRKIRKLLDDGHRVAIASNQGGVAWGYMTYDQAGDIMHHAGNLVGAHTTVFCPHWDGLPKDKVLGGSAEEDARLRFLYDQKCDCRKPKGGMILQVMKELGSSWKDSTFYIGDQETDMLAAIDAGLPKRNYFWAKDFFREDEEYDLCMKAIYGILKTAWEGGEIDPIYACAVLKNAVQIGIF